MNRHDTWPRGVVCAMFDDPRAAADALAPRERGYDPRGASFRLRTEVLPLGSLTLVRETYLEAASARGVPAPGTRSLSFFRYSEPGTSALGRDVMPGSTILTQDGQEWFGNVSRGTEISTIVFEPAHIAAEITGQRDGRAGLELPPFQIHLRRPPPALGRLAATLDSTWRLLDATRPSRVRHATSVQIERTLLAALVPCFDPLGCNREETSERSRRRRAFELAIAFADTVPHGFATVSSLCRVAGVSRRTLEYAFRETIGVGPARYLKRRRLDSARRDLADSRPDATVKEVALRWGFVDLSQFAGDYRRAFGELPSATLQPTPR